MKIKVILLSVVMTTVVGSSPLFAVDGKGMLDAPHRMMQSAMDASSAMVTEAMNIVEDNNMSLSKGSVFETPTPEAAMYPSAKPGKTDRIPKAYSTLPPQVTHRVEEYIPITLEENACMDCHDRRKLLGKVWKFGKKIPMPDTHYGSFGNEGASENVSGARYNCTQCHVAMSDAQPLVENTFEH